MAQAINTVHIFDTFFATTYFGKLIFGQKFNGVDYMPETIIEIKVEFLDNFLKALEILRFYYATSSREYELTLISVERETCVYFSIGPHNGPFNGPEFQKLQNLEVKARLRIPSSNIFFHFCSMLRLILPDLSSPTVTIQRNLHQLLYSLKTLEGRETKTFFEEVVSSAFLHSPQLNEKITALNLTELERMSLHTYVAGHLSTVKVMLFAVQTFHQFKCLKSEDYY
jgi:hypothetical protein